MKMVYYLFTVRFLEFKLEIHLMCYLVYVDVVSVFLTIFALFYFDMVFLLLKEIETKIMQKKIK